MLKYNKERLNAVIKDFCIVTGVSVAVLDTDFVTLVDYSEKPPRFCREIQKTQTGRDKCLCSDTEILQKCKESRRPEAHICHAGILDAAMPIIRADKIIGYILIGRTRVTELDERKIEWMRADYQKLKEMYGEITEYTDKQIKSLFELASMIVSFILTNDIITSELDEFSADAEKLIEKNLDKKISIELLCGELNVSRNLLYYNFKISFGMTVNEYIVSKRLQKGRELLKSTDISVADIAEKSGIGSYTYFSKLFKKRYGMSPSAFRKNNM